MVKKVSSQRVFELFLQSLGVEAQIEKTHSGFKTKEPCGSRFELFNNRRTILYKHSFVKMDEGVYVKDHKSYLYAIKETMGDIVVIDESGRKIVTLRDSHAVLRIGDETAESVGFSFQEQVAY